MNKFRTLNHNAAGEADVPLSNNYRPVQPLYGRRVSRSYTTLDASDVSGTAQSRGQTLAVVVIATVAMLAASLVSWN